MAYHEAMAERVRELLGARPGVVEKKMFGGLGWMIGGNMAVGIMRFDHLCVRIEPAETEAALREPGAMEFQMPGRKPMAGFVIVEPGVLEDDAVLASWVDRGADRASAMPPK
jgi:TfoX/Sxy family transcriptional regulator of competence genes